MAYKFSSLLEPSLPKWPGSSNVANSLLIMQRHTRSLEGKKCSFKSKVNRAISRRRPGNHPINWNTVG